MKTLKKLISEGEPRKRLTSLKELQDAIKQYKKDGEILNPDYQNLVYSARKIFETDAKIGHEILLDRVRGNDDVDDFVTDLYYDWPSDSFVRLNKISRNLAKFAKMDYGDKPFQKKLVKVGNDLTKVWQPIAADLKDMKKIVVKMTTKRDQVKQQKEKDLLQKKADSKVLVKELETIRKEYVQVATQRTKEFVKMKLADLKNQGNDLSKLLPKNIRTGEGKQLSILYNMITKQKGKRVSLRDPDIRMVDKKGVDRYVKIGTQQAEDNFDAFVNKMVEKVGPVKKADLTGQIWTNALLTVTTKDNKTEKWKTQIILNFSKYGKMFNQFPTRKQK